MDRMRIDKWLWAARFFKTRSIAANSCELGRISVNAQPAKASRDVRLGDLVQIRNVGEMEVEVLALSAMRGPAAVAQTLYRETEASRERREQLAAERKLMPQLQPVHEGRPSKRERREMDRIRGRD